MLVRNHRKNSRTPARQRQQVSPGGRHERRRGTAHQRGRRQRRKSPGHNRRMGAGLLRVRPRDRAVGGRYRAGRWGPATGGNKACGRAGVPPRRRNRTRARWEHRREQGMGAELQPKVEQWSAGQLAAASPAAAGSRGRHCGSGHGGRHGGGSGRGRLVVLAALQHGCGTQSRRVMQRGLVQQARPASHSRSAGWQGGHC